MAEVRLAEAVAALSLAIDIGMGQPLEQGLRTCLIATGLARKAGVDDQDCDRVFYLSLLRHVGCTAESDLAASFLGDEIAFRRGAITLDFTKPSAMFPYVIRHVGAGKSVVGRARHVGKMLAGGKTFMGAMDAVCETAQLLASRLGFDPVVQQALWQIFEHWDGKGLPGRVGGEEILLPARFVAIAELFEGLCRLEGPNQAVAAIQERRGKAFAPDIADCLSREADSFVPVFDQPSVWDDVVATEPSPRAPLSDEQLDDVLAAIADFTDLKSTYTLGHSRGVAELAALAADMAGLPATERTTIRRAGLVHDIGRVGVSAGIWGKKGGLSRDEWEKVRLHPYYTERVLTRPALFATLGELASTHHERLDGGGYPDGLVGGQIPLGARVIAVADTFDVLLHERPWKDEWTLEDAADEIHRSAGTHFDPAVVSAFDDIGAATLYALADEI